MKYFLTGATGFIGGRLARLLRQAGHEVIAVVRTPAKAQDLAAVGVQLVKGDVTDKESMRAPMTGVDGVYHVAGWYKVGVKDTGEGQRINVDGTRNVLELMRELKIPKGVYTSTLAVNSNTNGREVDETYKFTGQHLSVYDRTKADAHHVAEQFVAQGLPLVIVQPGLVYGPEDTSSVRGLIIQLIQRQLPAIPRVTAFSWAHVDDIAQAHILGMEKGRPGENYFICGPTHTLVEGIQIACEAAQVPMPLMVPPVFLSLGSALMRVIEKIATVPEAYTSEGLRVTAGVTYIGTNAKARRELGYTPRSLKEGLTATVKHEMKLLGKA